MICEIFSSFARHCYILATSKLVSIGFTCSPAQTVAKFMRTQCVWKWTKCQFTAAMTYTRLRFHTGIMLFYRRRFAV